MKLENFLPDSDDKSEFQDLLSYELNKEKVTSGLIFHPTGTGKTKTTLDLIKKMNPKNILWLVPSTQLRDKDVPEEFRKWKMDKFLKRSEIICYASAHKIKPNIYDIIVYDEAHHITRKVYEHLLKFAMISSKQMFLTATVPNDYTKKRFIENLVTSGSYNDTDVVIRSQMSVKDAQKRGFISDFDLKVVPVNLNSNINTNRYGKKLNEVTHYNLLCDLYEQKASTFQRNAAKMLALERLRFFKNLKSKTITLKKIVSNISSSKKYIVFCGSISQANSLSKHVYHSKSGDKHLKDFINGKINQLYVVDAIDEGVNLPKLDGIIVSQANSQSRTFVQRAGRALRKRKDKLHKSFIYLLVVKGTVDEKWVRTSIEEIGVEAQEYIDSKKHNILLI